MEIERGVAEQAYLVQYGFLVGTNAGEFSGRRVTGAPARFAYRDMHRIRDGKIVESWHIGELRRDDAAVELMHGLTGVTRRHRRQTKLVCAGHR
jgi:predicted ester cyclase